MSKVCELIIYTSQAAYSFYVEATTADFQERLAAALEEGTVILDTIEGSKLVLNAINVVAIDIHEATVAEVNADAIPPV